VPSLLTRAHQLIVSSLASKCQQALSIYYCISCHVPARPNYEKENAQVMHEINLLSHSLGHKGIISEMNSISTLHRNCISFLPPLFLLLHPSMVHFCFIFLILAERAQSLSHSPFMHTHKFCAHLFRGDLMHIFIPS
jgi:hypothetical protein